MNVGPASGKLYKVVSDLVVDKTEGADNRLMVLYKDKAGNRKVISRAEFEVKFEKTALLKYMASFRLAKTFKTKHSMTIIKLGIVAFEGEKVLVENPRAKAGSEREKGIVSSVAVSVNKLKQASVWYTVRLIRDQGFTGVKTAKPLRVKVRAEQLEKADFII